MHSVQTAHTLYNPQHAQHTTLHSTQPPTAARQLKRHPHPQRARQVQVLRAQLRPRQVRPPVQQQLHKVQKVLEARPVVAAVGRQSRDAAGADHDAAGGEDRAAAGQRGVVEGAAGLGVDEEAAGGVEDVDPLGAVAVWLVGRLVDGWGFCMCRFVAMGWGCERGAEGALQKDKTTPLRALPTPCDVLRR